MTLKSKLSALIFCVLLAGVAEARRVIPPVQQITHEGVIYSAPHEGSCGGIIVAHDEKTGVKLWDKRVYGVEFFRNLEEDVQWILINSLSVTNNHLLIVNEANHSFLLDIPTRLVTPVEKDMIVFEAVYDTMPRKWGYHFPAFLEMTCTMLRFERHEVDLLERTDQLDVQRIRDLLKEGKGVILANPRVNAVSGQEFVFKSVREVIYPTEMLSSNGQGDTDKVVGQAVALMPANFEMREVGAIFQCVPEYRPETKRIWVMANPQYIEEPVWKTYPAQLAVPHGKAVEAVLDQPFFPVYSVQTQVEIEDGETVLMGGGVPTADGEGLVYFLLTGKISKPEIRSGLE